MELNGRIVVDAEVEGADPSDSPKFCDAFFSRAVYLDSGEPLSYEELDELTDKYPEIVNQLAFESCI